MGRVDILVAGQVGDRAGQFEDAVIGAGAQIHLAHRGLHQTLARLLQLTETLHFGRTHIPIDGDIGLVHAGETVLLASTRPFHPPPEVCGRFAAVEAGRIQGELEDGRVVVVAGFQGITEDMDVTTLGRGASDLSAVAVAAAIRADRCEVYTDVEGIYTADPRHVPNARKLDEVGYDEMLEMASLGAKMQPRSIELAMQYQVPIVVASSFVDAPGTLIHRGADMEPRVGEIRNRARAVATDRNVAKITVTGIVDRPGISASLLEPLADADISVDIVVQNASVRDTTDLAFTVSGDDADRALEIVRNVAYTLGANDVIRTDNLAKVSVVGAAMQNAPGYASRMFRALADEGINIEMITTSEIRITCVVDAARVGDAARALHTTFGLEQPE